MPVRDTSTRPVFIGGQKGFIWWQLKYIHLKFIGYPGITLWPNFYNSQFTDLNGNIYKIENPDRSSYATCDHNYVDGTFSKHKKKSDGSCITSYYDAKRCSNCGQLVIESLISTETYQVCPH